MAHIFICYSRKDKSFCESFVKGLSWAYKQHEIFYDGDITGGTDWDGEIKAQINKCNLFIYLISNDSLESLPCQGEFRQTYLKYEAKHNNNEKVYDWFLPVIIRPGTNFDGDNIPEDLKNMLEKTQRVDLSSLDRESSDVFEFIACSNLFGSLNEMLLLFTIEDQAKPEDKTQQYGKDIVETPKANGVSQVEWKKHRTGNIYWLASDLTIAIPISRESDPKVVKDYVRKTFYHAHQLALGEPIEGRFERLWEKTCLYTQMDWSNPEKRQQITNELGALLHAIAFIMEGKGSEFNDNPLSEDWKKC